MMNRTSNTTQKTARAKIKIPYIRNASWLVIISGIIVLGSDSGSPVDSGSAWCPMAEKDNNLIYLNNESLEKNKMFDFLMSFMTFNAAPFYSKRYVYDFWPVLYRFSIFATYGKWKKNAREQVVRLYIFIGISVYFRWAGNRFMSSCVNTTLKKPNFKRRHSPKRSCIRRNLVALR